MGASTLDAFLMSQQRADPAVAATIRALAGAAIRVNNSIRFGILGAAFSAYRGTFNADGDAQKDLDIHADETFLQAMRSAPVRCVASEERLHPVTLDPEAPLALALDPLDGSSNVDVNMSIGTIFSLLPATGEPGSDPATFFLRPGRGQVAAGFFVYGPQLALVLTLGGGTHGFTFSPSVGTFLQTHADLAIPGSCREFAINASNYRHWDEAVRLYVDDCLKGEEGPRGRDFNMRWVASLVAEVFRILKRGGVFLYPGDGRAGYGNGRLRLVYEANPIAMLVEQAGGAATDTTCPILDLQPTALHQRVPLVLGAASEVARIARYHTDPSAIAERSPLFGNRGLFRA